MFLGGCKVQWEQIHSHSSNNWFSKTYQCTVYRNPYSLLHLLVSTKKSTHFYVVVVTATVDLCVSLNSHGLITVALGKFTCAFGFCMIQKMKQVITKLINTKKSRNAFEKFHVKLNHLHLFWYFHLKGDQTTFECYTWFL